MPSRARSNCRVAKRVLTLNSSTPHILLIRDKEEEEDAYLVPTLLAEVQDGIIVSIAASEYIKSGIYKNQQPVQASVGRLGSESIKHLLLAAFSYRGTATPFGRTPV